MSENRNFAPKPTYEALEDKIDTLEAELAAAKRGMEKMECGHPRTVEVGHPNDSSMGYCTLCADITAAYERGKRDAADCLCEQAYKWRNNVKKPFVVEDASVYLAEENEIGARRILALQDKGPKGGRE
jgi:hypothetical protein